MQTKDKPIDQANDMTLSSGEGAVGSPKNVTISRVGTSTNGDVVDGLGHEVLELDRVSGHRNGVVLRRSGDAGEMVERSDRDAIVSDEFALLAVEDLRWHPIDVQHRVRFLDEMEIGRSGQPAEDSFGKVRCGEDCRDEPELLALGETVHRHVILRHRVEVAKQGVVQLRC